MQFYYSSPLMKKLSASVVPPPLSHCVPCHNNMASEMRINKSDKNEFFTHLNTKSIRSLDKTLYTNKTTVPFLVTFIFINIAI